MVIRERTQKRRASSEGQIALRLARHRQLEYDLKHQGRELDRARRTFVFV